jgi:hypothetical protein
MKRNELKQKLEQSNLFKNDSSIRSLLNGTRYPSYNKAVILEEKHQVPVEAWKDIKSFLNKSVTKDENNNEVQKAS